MEKVKKEEEFYSFDAANEVIDASPCSVYFGGCGIPVPRRTTGPTRQSTRGWTEEEDNLLTETVRKFHGRNWKRIAKCLPGRSVSQCFCRWQRVLNPEVVKGPWTKEEDDCIIELVRKYGFRKWSFIAKSLPGRLGKQCRERWYNHLDPALNRAPWTKAEDSILTYYHEIHGNKWSEISKFLPGRSDNAIKNHWNCIKKKSESNSARGCTMVPHPSSSSNFCSCALKPDYVKVKEKKRSPDRTVCPDENIGLKHNAQTSNLELVLGIMDGGENHLQSNDSTGGTARPAVWLDEPKNGMYFEDREAGARDENIQSGRSNVRYDNTNSSCNSLEAFFPFLSMSAEFNGLVGALDSDISRFSNTNPPASRSGKDNGHVGENDKAQQSLLQAESVSEHSLNHESAKLTDLVVAVNDKETTGIDKPAMEYCSTPRNLSQIVSVNDISPESILRNSARSFKNTPSIIRKRTSRDAGFANSARRPPSKISYLHNVEDATNTSKQGFPAFFPETSPALAIESVRRHLGCAFDMESNSASSTLGNLLTASPSMNFQFSENVMVIP